MDPPVKQDCGARLQERFDKFYGTDVNPLIISDNFLAKKTMDNRRASRNPKRPIGFLFQILLNLGNCLDTGQEKCIQIRGTHKGETQKHNSAPPPQGEKGVHNMHITVRQIKILKFHIWHGLYSKFQTCQDFEKQL